MWDDEDTVRDDIDGAPIVLKFSGRDEKRYSHFRCVFKKPSPKSIQNLA
jgi:hypothetical protein